MKTIPAKSILSAYLNGDGWFGANYNMNLYKGCPHGCIYCDSRSECYRIDHFEVVRAKENALCLLEKELSTRRKKGIVMTGAMNDPYAPVERETQLTHKALSLLAQYGFGAAVLTKSPLVTRDLAVLQRVRAYAPAFVNITITTADDSLCKKIERFVPPSSERFQALKELSNGGISCGVLLMPILPFLNDTQDNIRTIVRRASECGASWVYPGFGVTLRQNQREYFLERLSESFPGLAKKYIETFGSQYYCESPNANSLWDAFCDECDRCRIRYRMQDIVALLNQDYDKNQISLF